MTGPPVRSDVVDVYVFRLRRDHAGSGQCPRPPGHVGVVEFLQMRRVDKPMAASWQPVMGHIQHQTAIGEGETATEAALRELQEETGYRPGGGLVAFWQLESVNTYFLASENCIMMSPCFAAQVTAEIDPVPDLAHDSFRWVRRDHVDRCFVWPGQRLAVGYIVRELLPAILAPDTQAPQDGSVSDFLQIDLGGQ